MTSKQFRNEKEIHQEQKHEYLFTCAVIYNTNVYRYYVNFCNGNFLISYEHCQPKAIFKQLD